MNIPFNSKKIVKTGFLKIMSIRRQKNTNTHFSRYLAINNFNLTRKNCKFYLPFREDENHVNSTKLRKVRKLQKNHPFLVATKGFYALAHPFLRIFFFPVGITITTAELLSPFSVQASERSRTMENDTRIQK